MANNGLKVTVDVEGMKELNKVLSEYMKWTKQQPSEVVNAKMYFIALNALQTTKQADPSHIKGELAQPSQKRPNMTLGEILTLKDLQKRGKMPKKGKTLIKNMSKYVATFLNKRLSHINFLRSGWLPTIKKLDYWNRKGDYVFTKRMAPKLNRAVKQFGKEKGDVIPAKPFNVRVKGVMSNFVGQGEQASSTVKPILLAGAEAAVRREVASMRTYLERKYKEYHDKLNKRNTFL